MHYILIADSGSTKTDWMACLSNDPLNSSRLFQTQGINPYHQNDDAILTILQQELLPGLMSAGLWPSGLKTIRFYGSGVRPEQEQRMRRLLLDAMPEANDVLVKSDMLGAAHALCGDREGIVCILGTGANSCLYDGRQIVQNTPPLGYVLGDEGSGAVLGIRFLNALYKNRLYQNAQAEFEDAFKLSMGDVISHVYRQPMANRWLASLSTYIHQHLSQPTVRALVVDNFRLFVRYNLEPYGRHDLPVSAVGSIAYFYLEQFREALQEEDYRMGTVFRSPIEGLQHYWCKE